MQADIWRGVKRILAVRMDNIGDVIMLGPALRALRHNLPDASITLLASPGGAQVAPLLPWVDDVIPWRALWQDISGQIPFDPLHELDLIEELQEKEFDAAFIFTSFSQSPFPPAYACYLAGIPVRVGHSKEFGGGVLSLAGRPPPEEGHQAERNLALIELAGMEVPRRDLELHVPASVQERADDLLRDTGLDPRTPYLLLAPGASAAARRYPPERFAAVAQMLARALNIPILIAGSERESQTIAPVAKTADGMRIFSIVGKTNVAEFAAVVRRSDFVLANNSGGLHLADAFRIPMVILYSGTETESQWMPRSTPSRLMRRMTDCAPCRNFRCPYGLECLDFTPVEVVESVCSLLAEMREKQPRQTEK
jgi:lipopolysaccharide heptosyltransferase II